MAVAKTSSLELNDDLLKIHNPPRRQNVNAKTAPILAIVFMFVFCWFLFDVRTMPNEES